MELNTLSVIRLQMLEAGQFINRFIIDFENAKLDASKDPVFKEFLESLQLQAPIFENALMQVKAKAESEMIMELDNIRDKKITTLRRASKVFEYSDTEEEQEAYKTIKIVLQTYKDIENINFESETLAINNLIKELKGSQYIGFTNKLNLEKHIANLEVANNNFQAVFDKRSSETITTITYNTKELRKNIFVTYTEMVNYVLVMANIKKEGFFIDTLTIINNGRKYFADILAKRKGVSKKTNE